MTDLEKRLIQKIRDAKDPTAAIETVCDMITRLLNGEDPDSIAASYGLVRNKDGRFERAAEGAAVS